MIDIRHALTITGWMFEEELLWLAEQASTCQHIIEVGSYHGRSTVAMAANSSAEIGAIDTWDGPVTADSEEQVGHSDFKVFCDNTRQYRNIYPIISSSLAAAKRFYTPRDMIFLDASHAYEDVRADILAWRTKVRPGGILCGHDYGTWPGVQQAVDECFPDINRVGSIWSVVL